MRILFISKYAVSPKCGDPTRQYFYCKYLARQERNVVQLISSRSAGCPLLSPFKGRKTEFQYVGLSHVVLNGPRIDFGLNLKRIWSWIWFEVQVLRNFGSIKSWKPDVVIVSSLSILTFLTGVVLKRLLKIPLVIEVRDVYPATLIALGRFGHYHPLVLCLGWIEKLAYREADAIISSLPNLKPHVCKSLGYEKEISYLPMGYDPEYHLDVQPLSNVGKSIQDLIQSEPNAFWIGYFGAIGKANALDCPLSAFRKLSVQHPHIHFLVAGDGPLRSKYQFEYSDVRTIHFVGKTSKTDLPQLIQSMSLVVNPWLDRSIYECGVSPNKWIDYMLAAKPILCSFGGYKLWLHEQKCGWFIGPENAKEFLEKVVELSRLSANDLNEIGQRGRQYLLRELSYVKLAEKLQGMLLQVTQLAI